MIYTFRTTSFKDELKKQFSDLFVFGKLKKDFELLSKRILEEKPNYVLGIAKTTKESQFESATINQFNTNKKIASDGELIFNLNIPSNIPFKVSKNNSDSFCNWTTYKIASFIDENRLDTKVMFIHLNEEDCPKLIKFLTELETQIK